MQRSTRRDLPAASIVVADFVARGHVNSGIQCHAEIQKAYATASQSGEPINLPYVLSLAMPAISNLTLGLEIFLKMHHFQNTGRFPTGHNIGDLTTTFDATVQSALHNIYLSMCENEAIKSAATINLRIGTEVSDLNVLLLEDAPNLESAATQIGRAYERWRYIYEELHSPLQATIAFRPLLAMIYTIDFAIRNFRSDAIIEVGESAA